jgi:hypothetical protein
MEFIHQGKLFEMAQRYLHRIPRRIHGTGPPYGNLPIRIVVALCGSYQQTVHDAKIAATLTIDWLLFENNEMMLRKEWARVASLRCSRIAGR